MEEKQVWNYNHGIHARTRRPRTDTPPEETLVAMYPSEAALIADHPYAI